MQLQSPISILYSSAFVLYLPEGTVEWGRGNWQNINGILEVLVKKVVVSKSIIHIPCVLSRAMEEAGKCPICHRTMKKVRKIFSV